MATQPRGTVLPHLGAWRRYRAHSLAELAALAQIAKSTVARAEAGGVTTWENVTKLAKALRVAPHTLEHEPPPDASRLPDTPAPDLAGMGGVVEGWRQTVARLAALAEGFDAESAADRAAVDAATEALVRVWVRLRLALAALTGRVGE